MKAVVFFLTALLANASPEFVGVLTLGGDSLFAVMDGAVPPKWMRIGDEVSGYRILAYRAKEEVLVLKSEIAALELKLRDSKVRDKRSEVSSADAYAVAIREVQRREAWGGSARYDKPQRGRKNWLIPVFHRLPDGREECVLVGVGLITGEIAEYRHFPPSP